MKQVGSSKRRQAIGQSQSSNRGQASLEYLILIGAVIAVAAIVILYISNISSSGQTSTSFSACRTAASQCLNGVANYGPDFDCTTICQRSCIDPVTNKDLMSGDTGDLACDKANPSACGYCMNGDLSSIRPNQ